MNDSQIISLFWSRNEDALRETSDKYGKYCYSIAYRILGDDRDAEECVNDSYLNLWNSIPPHQPARLAPFLGKITRFLALKKQRSNRTQKRGGKQFLMAYDELEECLPGKEDPAEQLQMQELAETIDRFLDRLSEDEQRCFISRYWFFDSIAEISQKTGFTQSKIKSILFRTRKQLQNHLKKEGYLNE